MVRVIKAIHLSLITIHYQNNMEKIKLGEYNRLKILRKVDFGLYLEAGVEGEILLPQRYVPEHYAIGDELDVFVYLDNEERPVATTEKPLAQVGDFAYLEVAWVNQYGAFLKWGPMKDLFCPFREQKMRMEIGKSYIVHVHIDEESYRVVASAKVDRYLQPTIYERGQEVDILVWQKTDLGFKAIINNCWQGLIYKDQIFQYIHTGDRMKAWVQRIRQDGKVDLSLQPTGRQATLDFAATLLNYLKENGGVCHLGDKSDAEEIKQQFQVSKKVFKKAVGDLYRQRLITIAPTEIRLCANAK